MSEDFELTLWDRLEMIRAVLQTVPYENIYLSFSGGKDSTVLHHMLDEALPGNTIERVFSNTGIEFNDVVDFVKGMAAEDSRIKIIRPNKTSNTCLMKSDIRLSRNYILNWLNDINEKDTAT